MIYQEILTDHNQYFITIDNASPFCSHRHHEIEISYCAQGSYEVISDTQHFTLEPGDFAIIPSMAQHEMRKQNIKDGKRITIEFGYAFLSNHFEHFASKIPNTLIIKRDSCSKELIECLNEIMQLKETNKPFCELLIKGYVYQFVGLIMQSYTAKTSTSETTKRNDIKRIDPAIEAIYRRYYEPLDIDSVSILCGYNKSNFCKIFKNITGTTFHTMLNRHRIEIACNLLLSCNDSIEKIAERTGFSDTKSFCRVFKKTMGISAGEYKKARILANPIK